MSDQHPQPLDSDWIPRYADVQTFMRLPIARSFEDVDIAIVGIPWDGGATDRPGARLGPRSVRIASGNNRLIHGVSFTQPFKDTRVVDGGDVAPNPVNRSLALTQIESFIAKIQQFGALPLVVGGDHLVSLPVLQAINVQRPFALIHLDAHVDLWDVDFADETLTHGTVFRRAIEEGILDPLRIVQVGIRELIHSPNDLKFGQENGITTFSVADVQKISIEKVIEKIKQVIGTTPVYLSLDIDVLDPAFAPGTGTPEVGGLSTHEIMRLLRGLEGMMFVGADLVEVAPPFDSSDITALSGATLLFELLCLLSRTVQNSHLNQSLVE